MRAQLPPCPCDFWARLELARGEPVCNYLHMGLNLLDVCSTESADATVTLMADTVAPIGQGADLHAKDNGGDTPLLCLYVWSYRGGHGIAG